MADEWKYFGFQANSEEQIAVERNRRLRGLRTVSEYLRSLIREDDQKNFGQNIHIVNNELTEEHTAAR